MMNKINFPYALILTYDNGDQFTAGEYLMLKDTIRAKNHCKAELGKRGICGRTLTAITILKNGGGK